MKVLSKRSWLSLVAGSLILFVASVASAYTLVMKDGRRVQIPDAFVVTNSTLTYQVATDIQVTVQLASVDIAATHRLNKDERLLVRTEALPPQTPVVMSTPTQQPRVSRTITNTDLEGYRKTRVESELAYEKRRKELGLPSLAEQRQALSELTERAREQAVKIQLSDTQSETYWRQRAYGLKAEINASDARIQSVRQMLETATPTYAFGALTTAFPTTFGVPFGINNNFPRPARTGVFLPRNSGTSVSVGARIPFGRNGNLSINTRSFYKRGYYNRYGQGAILAVPFQQSDYGYERTSLINQLNELTVYRAGLLSRWRDLEEEARRAGAYPGWLR